ncbi:hypothetical protein [Photorhabdus heterorhabditis]|uniref:Uncharacterized protein n=2 Tax=Photorhabdus heterorhabditis TaxID=880156 RepID=A0A5B0WHS1_9GAMM|nr:hypothetical protein [Photorhabdus heterorhabditis]KAA1186442.1 hypothetical protein F0L16_14015 [Photorhabdus heterorhabditis]
MSKLHRCCEHISGLPGTCYLDSPAILLAYHLTFKRFRLCMALWFIWIVASLICGFGELLPVRYLIFSLPCQFLAIGIIQFQLNALHPEKKMSKNLLSKILKSNEVSEDEKAQIRKIFISKSEPLRMGDLYRLRDFNRQIPT